MTAADAEGPAPVSLTVLAVHGLPDENTRPESQLEPIKDELRLEASDWRDHIWCPDTRPFAVARRVVHRLGRREFASYFTDYSGTEAPGFVRDPEPFTRG